MNQKAIFYVRAGLVLLGLLAFLYLYGRAMIESIGAQSAPVYSDAYSYVATALAGLVGGVAAATLGQSSLAGVRGRKAFAPLGKTLAPYQSVTLQEGLALAYTIAYALYGVAALLVWVSAPGEAGVVEMVRSLALIFLGLALAVAQSFLGLPQMTRERSATRGGARKHH